MKTPESMPLFVANIVFACLVGGSVVGCGTAPGQTGALWHCVCACEDECAREQIRTDTSTLQSFCTAADPNFGGASLTDGANQLELLTQICIVAAQSNQAAADAACAQECAGRTHQIITITGGQQPTIFDVSGSLTAPTEICALEIPASPRTGACSVPNGQVTVHVTPLTTTDNTTTVDMTPQSSQAMLSEPGGDGAVLTPLPAPSGIVTFHGGNCPGLACPIVLDHVEWRSPPFSAHGFVVGETVIFNTSPVIGSKAVNGQIMFPQSALNATISTSLNFTPSLGTLIPDSAITGSYDVVSGQLQLAATFSQATGESVSFTLAGQASSRPPVIIPGNNQTVSCGTNGPAAVVVDGSASFDPDGSALQFAWSENGTVLARSASATLSLSFGPHTLSLTAKDATGRTAQGTLQVTVADGTAPQFTFVPPTVMQESTGAATLGQALAKDNCGGTVGVTNNAPASFPIGRTTVTWTASDAAGNRATATQDVWVLPASTASCPAGTHIILGTPSNDVLIGTSGRDCIIGFGGQDRIDGLGGDDVLIGGDGDDIITGGDGNDVIFGGSGQDNISGGTGNDVAGGGDGDDTISGGDGDDTLVGGQGTDHLNGDAGNDVLVGNAGDDVLQGGAGNDRCVVDSGHDTVLTCER